SGFAGMSSAGLAIGPILGGVLTDLFNFRAVFWVYGVMALFTLLVSFRIPETYKERSGQRRPLLNLGKISEVDPYFRVTFVILIINTFVAMMRSSLINSML